MREYELTHQVYKRKVQEGHRLGPNTRRSLKIRKLFCTTTRKSFFCLMSDVLDKSKKLNDMEQSPKETKLEE